MKYLSLFSGIGGFELGIQNALSKTKRKQQRGIEEDSSLYGEEQLGAQCVGYSEIDKYAVQIYQKHFPEHKNYGDITKINADTLPDFDLLCGGFPCQSFSIAGLRKGFEDTRGTLFFDIARILKKKQPRRFLLENVKGLLSHDNGNTFKTIISTLDELGYDLQWQVLNSKNFGVPQNRERVFIVGHLRGTSRPQVFPFTESQDVHLREITTGVSDAQRIYETSGTSKTLKGLGGGLGAKTGLYKLNPSVDEKGITTALDANYYKGIGSRGNKWRAVATEWTGECFGECKNDDCPHNWQIRRLTPTECARLQGFPDDWHKIEGISDTQAYKCYGNAVTVNVIEAIIKSLTS